MMGDPEFESDERHLLYREYQKIIIDHCPPVFVMENVKGLLSAQVGGKPVIQRIVSDLDIIRSTVGHTQASTTARCSRGAISKSGTVATQRLAHPAKMERT
jgi:DNA (cytosine-5)-methyltransferase 1